MAVFLIDPPLLYALGICAASAALEGLFAGGGIKQRLAELRVPRFAPPLGIWIVIGVLYYTICFVLLYRLLSLPAMTAQRTIALAMLGGLMFINAAWNYFFFRTRNLFHAFVIGVPYGLVAVALLLVLLRFDPISACWLSPYIVYLLYASTWGYQVWKLNPRPTDRRETTG